MDFLTATNVALQTHAPGLTLLMQIVSIFGLPEFYLIVIPLILWCFDKKLGLRLIFLLTISTAVNAMLKIVFHTPRPYWVNSEVRALVSEPSFGMPSAHAQASLAFLGYISAWFKRTEIWIISVFLVILVGIARIYLGAHFLTDVLTGWIAALIILLVFIRYETSFTGWFLQKPIKIRILFAFLASFAIIILSEIIFFSLGTWQVPSEWYAMAFAQTQASINPLSMQDILMPAGLLFGAATGAIICSDYNPYRVDGSKLRKTVRYLTGIIVLFLLWMGLGTAAKSPGLAGYGMTYFRAAIAGLWITAGAPFFFCKLGLADNKIQ